MSRENGSLFPGVQRERDSKLNQTLKRTVTIKALKHRTGFTTGRLGMLTMAQRINIERKAAKLFKKKKSTEKVLILLLLILLSLLLVSIISSKTTVLLKQK